jgi:hypothetical protein
MQSFLFDLRSLFGRPLFAQRPVRANTTIFEKEPHMTTVQPDSENIRRAAKWIIEERQYNPNQSLGKLIEEAGNKFDLSPLETEFLERFVKEESV